jgi:hypothetical protein
MCSVPHLQIAFMNIQISILVLLYHRDVAAEMKTVYSFNVGHSDSAKCVSHSHDATVIYFWFS